MIDNDWYWVKTWHDVGHHSLCLGSCPNAGQAHPDYDAASDWAIDKLMRAGHTQPNTDNELAQTHLTLAALISPTLMGV